MSTEMNFVNARHGRYLLKLYASKEFSTQKLHSEHCKQLDQLNSKKEEDKILFCHVIARLRSFLHRIFRGESYLESKLVVFSPNGKEFRLDYTDLQEKLKDDETSTNWNPDREDRNFRVNPTQLLPEVWILFFDFSKLFFKIIIYFFIFEIGCKCSS